MREPSSEREGLGRPPPDSSACCACLPASAAVVFSSQESCFQAALPGSLLLLLSPSRPHTLPFLRAFYLQSPSLLEAAGAAQRSQAPAFPPTPSGLWVGPGRQLGLRLVRKEAPKSGAGRALSWSLGTA